MWLQESYGFEPPIWKPPKDLRIPRHDDNDGKMPCNLAALTTNWSKVRTAHGPRSPGHIMTIPLAVTDYDPRT